MLCPFSGSEQRVGFLGPNVSGAEVIYPEFEGAEIAEDDLVA
jgi:hypothetical protein